MIHARDDYNRIQDPEGKIEQDEPVFLLRAKDPLFIPILQIYAFLYGYISASNKFNFMYNTLMNHIILATEWRNINREKCKKCSDIPGMEGME